MSIKTRLMALVAGFTTVLLALGLLLSFSLRTTERLSESAAAARNVSRAVLELNLLVDDYTVFPTERAEQQWRTRHASLGRLLEEPDLRSVEEWPEGALEVHRRMRALFDELAETLEAGDATRARGLTVREIRIASELRLATLSLSESIAAFETVLEEKRSAEERRDLVLTGLVALVSSALTFGAGITVWRTLGRPLVAMRDGVRRIAGGERDHRLGFTGRGEIDDLARAFDEMADAVGRSTDELEALVAQRTGQLVETNRQLEEATHAKDRFMARMSHELRTPLNSIIGFSRIMADGHAGPVTEEQATQLAMVNRAGRRLLSLVNDLLDISRIAAGGVEVGCGPVDLGELVDEVATTIAPLAAEKGLDVEHSSADGDPLVTDRAKVEQILLNLLGNAIKFTDAGTVSLYAERTEEGGARIAVSDTGMGIAPQHLPELFDEFKQFGDTDDEIRPGSGLGLAIARSLAELLGGAIEVESEPGVGSTFTLVLPAEPPGGSECTTASGEPR